MKNLNKIITLFIVICQLFFCLAACKKQPDSEGSSTADASFKLTWEQLSAYTIVVPEKSEKEMNPVATMLNNIIKTATGAALQIKTDNIAEGSDYYFESEYEILIGYTDRKEAREFYNSFKKDDSGYALVGKKLLILGYTGEGANKSALLFKTDLLDKKSNSDVLLNAGESKIVSSKYEYQTILLNGTDISKYKIVYPKVSSKGEKEIATYLQEWIAYHTGYILNCVNDSAQAGEYEIQIGTTSRITSEMLSARDADGFNDEKTYIGINGKTVWLSGNSRMALYTAFTKLTNFAVFSDTNISIDINSSDSYPINQLKVSVMNYNIYYDLNEKKRNPDDVIVSIKQKNADVFGLLEAGADWIAKINPEVSATYTCVTGKPVDTTKDASYNPIYYKTDKFDLIEWGTKWLSDTPDKMSRYPTAKHYKVLTYVILKDKATGARFMYINIHLDGSNDAAAHSALKEVRKWQVEVFKNFIAKYNFLPIIAGGDFNENPTHSTITAVSANSRLISCANIAEKKVIVPSDVNSEFDAIGTASLDYLFVTPDSVKVEKFEVWDNKINGKYPSDHLPVCAELAICF